MRIARKHPWRSAGHRVVIALFGELHELQEPLCEVREPWELTSYAATQEMGGA